MMAKDCAEKIEKITPSPSELVMTSWQEKLPVKCSEPGCSHIAANQSVLNLHKAKVHKIRASLDKNIIKQFHCPVSSCYFNSASERYFKNIDILRVHYMKVHYEKNFKCSKCDKRFGLARDCLRHEGECGQLFSCPDCGKVYSKKDSLLKHCDVQKHSKPSFPPKPKPVKKSRAEKAKKIETIAEKKRETPEQPNQISFPMESQRVDLQKDMTKAQIIVSKPSQSVCQAVQTSCRPFTTSVSTVCAQTAPYLPEPLHASFQCPNEKISMGIQTIVLVPSSQQSDANVQTNDYIDKFLLKPAAIPKVKMNKSTQKSPFRKKLKQNVIKSSSSSQTNPPPLPKKPHLKFKPKSSISLNDAKTSASLTQPSLWSTHILTPSHYDEEKLESEPCHPELASSIDDILTSISTQTDFSCRLDQFLPDSQNNNLSQLPTHDSHTQTSRNELYQLSFDGLQNPFHLFENKNIQTNNLDYQEQTTQTKVNTYDFKSQTLDLDTSYINYENTFDTCQSDTCGARDYFIPLLNKAQDNKRGQMTDFNIHITPQKQHNIVQTPTCSNSLPVSLPTELTDTYTQHANIPKRNPESKASQHQPDPAEMETAATTGEPADFAWDMGTQTFDNLMWEMGTQTFEDLATEIGTQTIADFMPLQTIDTPNLEIGTQTRADATSLQRGPQGMFVTSVLHRLSPLGFEIGTQTKIGNLVSHETVGTGWETASQTMDDVNFEFQVQEVDKTTARRREEKLVTHLNYKTDYQTLKDLDLETQTMIGNPISEVTASMGMDIEVQTEAEITALQTLDDLCLEMGTQTMAGMTYMSTVNNLSLDTGTQTMTDMSSLPIVDNSGLDIATQTLADFTCLPSVDSLSLDMETQTMADIMHLTKLDSLNLEMGTQTVADTTPLSTLDTDNSEIESQAMVDISCLSIANNHCLEMGTQTLADLTLLSALHNMGLEMETNTMNNASYQTTDDLVSDMETQTVCDMATSDTTADALDRIIGMQAMCDTAAQQNVGGLDSEMGTQTMANITSLHAEDSHSFEMGTQTISNMMALPAVDDLSFGMATQTLEQLITNSCTQTENTQLWYDNVVTQTEEDLLEFLTRETQTQTGDDLLEFLTRETQTQTHTEACGNERAAQTDMDLLDFFTTATPTHVVEALSNPTSMNHVEVGTGDDLLEFLTKESETQTQANF